MCLCQHTLKTSCTYCYVNSSHFLLDQSCIRRRVLVTHVGTNSKSNLLCVYGVLQQENEQGLGGMAVLDTNNEMGEGGKS